MNLAVNKIVQGALLISVLGIFLLAIDTQADACPSCKNSLKGGDDDSNAIGAGPVDKQDKSQQPNEARGYALSIYLVLGVISLLAFFVIRIIMKFSREDLWNQDPSDSSSTLTMDPAQPRS